VILRVRPDGSDAEVASVGRVVRSISRTNDALLVLTGSEESKLWHVPFDRPDERSDLLAESERVTLNTVAWLMRGIYLTDFHGGRVLQLENGRLLTVATGMENPNELTAAPDGTVFIAEFGRGAVRRILTP
jgi:hypothetical protein